MVKATRIELEQDETSVLHVASRMFAAYIAGKEVSPEKEEALFEKLN